MLICQNNVLVYTFRSLWPVDPSAWLKYFICLIQHDEDGPHLETSILTVDTTKKTYLKYLFSKIGLHHLEYYV